MNPADFETAAAIVQHQLTEALPRSGTITVKFVNPTLQIRTQAPQETEAIVRSLLTALSDCREALSRLPIQTVTLYGMQGDRNILWKRSMSLEMALDLKAKRADADPFSFRKAIGQPVCIADRLSKRWNGPLDGVGFAIIRRKNLDS